MAKKSEKFSIVEICPIRNVVSRFGNKWALLVILILSENGSCRFNQLGKLIPDISTKVLSNTLRTLEADGLVERTPRGTDSCRVRTHCDGYIVSAYHSATYRMGQ